MTEDVKRTTAHLNMVFKRKIYELKTNEKAVNGPDRGTREDAFRQKVTEKVNQKGDCVAVARARAGVN